MKNLLTTVLCALFAIDVQGQIDILRYNDNFSYLKKDSVTKIGSEKLKYIPIPGIGTASFGGEIREQIQCYQNPNFGDAAVRSGTQSIMQLWHRSMAHANFEIGHKAIIFAQFGSTFRLFNPNPPVPEIDENHLSIHQLFGEYRFDTNWKIRVGRQELSYGSHRLITFREGPNTRLAFDAAIIKHSSVKRKADFFIMSPVVSRKGAFDDEVCKDILVGFYATEKVRPRVLILDYYILNFQSQRRKYNYIIGDDNRYVGGIRAFSETHFLNYESELTYQFGKFNDLQIKAYSASADLNYHLLADSKLVIGLAGSYASGDRSSGDRQLNTYNSLFSKPPYGLTAAIGQANIIAYGPYLKSAPIAGSYVYAGASFMRRQSSRDGIYTPDGTEVRPRPGMPLVMTDKEIGTLVSIETSYSVSRHFSVAFDASHFFAGSFIRQTGKGNDINYISFKAGYKF